jgi:4-hydroxybenzoate polyprenyltransferase
MIKRIMNFMFVWRIDRVIMLSAVTAATAWGFGATPANTILSAFLGAFLCAAGFYLDYIADARKDRASGKISNPIASDQMPFNLAVAFVVICAGIAVALGYVVNPWSLLPIAAVLLIISLEATVVMSSPISRAASLGLLQALYALIGCLASHKFNFAIIWICLFLFFAMSGGRILGDFRDIEQDRISGVKSFPLTFGIKFSIFFLFSSEFLAYAAGFAALHPGGLGRNWLYPICAITLAGTIINILFSRKPLPKQAKFYNSLSLGLLGGLYIIGMIMVHK